MADCMGNLLYCSCCSILHANIVEVRSAQAENVKAVAAWGMEYLVVSRVVVHHLCPV